MILSNFGIALIQFFEDFSAKAYRRFPSEPWTCGYGHTGTDVTEGTVCTSAQALAWLVEDTRGAASSVNADVKVQLTQPQFDALVSLVYNAGSVTLEHRHGEVWTDSTLLQYLNTGNTIAAATEFPEWAHVGGALNAGLLRRRYLEQALFSYRTTS